MMITLAERRLKLEENSKCLQNVKMKIIISYCIPTAQSNYSQNQAFFKLGNRSSYMYIHYWNILQVKNLCESAKKFTPCDLTIGLHSNILCVCMYAQLKSSTTLANNTCPYY